jgi:hypothetical protein
LPSRFEIWITKPFPSGDVEEPADRIAMRKLAAALVDCCHYLGCVLDGGVSRELWLFAEEIDDPETELSDLAGFKRCRALSLDEDRRGVNEAVSVCKLRNNFGIVSDDAVHKDGERIDSGVSASTDDQIPRVEGICMISAHS